VIVSVAVSVVPERAAEIVAGVCEATFVVLTTKVAEVNPAAILTVAGTLAEGLLLDRGITNPPAGAAEDRRTVAVLVLPPATVAGFSVNDLS
jgi:hypothetical protein